MLDTDSRLVHTLLVRTLDQKEGEGHSPIAIWFHAPNLTTGILAYPLHSPAFRTNDDTAVRMPKGDGVGVGRHVVWNRLLGDAFKQDIYLCMRGAKSILFSI